MPEFRIDLRDRFIAAFGFVADNALDTILNNKYVLPQPFQEDTPVGFSKMGTPFFDQFNFEHKPTEGTQFNYKFEIPPMVDLSIAKRLNITTINDAEIDGEVIGGGEVIESWGNEAYDITFRGLLVDMDNHIRPYDQIDQLVQFFQVNGIYEARESRLFNLAKITRIYVKSLSLPALEGFVDTQPFVIQARSYVAATLEITD